MAVPVGQIFGYLTVLGRGERNNRGALMWLCKCSCGAEKSVRPDKLREGRTKSCGCRRRQRPERSLGSGRRKDKDGYVVILEKTHPNSDKNGYVFEHRKVMSNYLGRPLLPQESVHHINGIRSDNRLENLELWSKSQPRGQRVIDKLYWAEEIQKLYWLEIGFRPDPRFLRCTQRRLDLVA